MTKLMKAKTANTKAASVDRKELALTNIAGEIARVVSYGGFAASYYSSDNADNDAYVIGALRTAGYSVTEDEPLRVYSAPPGPKTWYEKVFAWVPQIDDAHLYDEPCHYLRSWTISWNLTRETQSAK
jgi:hypothetical protein